MPRATAAACLLAAALLVPGCGRSTGACGSASPAETAAREAHQREALAQWAAEEPWRGWADGAAWRRCEESGEAPDGLLASPGFRRAERAFGLKGGDLARYRAVFGEPDAPELIPHSLRTRIARDRGLPTKETPWFYWWKGSLGCVRYQACGLGHTGWSVVAPFRADVVEVDEESGEITLSRGADGALAVGRICHIYRGYDYIATVVIRRVSAKKSVAETTVRGRGKIRAGDAAEGSWTDPALRPSTDGTAIRASILAVDNNVNLVMLSVGADDGVKKGHVFTVFRGEEIVAKVLVERTFRDMCSARIMIPPMTRRMIREGDKAIMKARPRDDARGRIDPPEAMPELDLARLVYGDGKPAPPINAKVLTVDEKAGVVKLSAGSGDGVKRGDSFTVYRVDLYIGKVAVERVAEGSSEARIIVPDMAHGRKIRPGDSAATRVY